MSDQETTLTCSCGRTFSYQAVFDRHLQVTGHTPAEPGSAPVASSPQAPVQTQTAGETPVPRPPLSRSSVERVTAPVHGSDPVHTLPSVVAFDPAQLQNTISSGEWKQPEPPVVDQAIQILVHRQRVLELERARLERSRQVEEIKLQFALWLDGKFSQSLETGRRVLATLLLILFWTTALVTGLTVGKAIGSLAFAPAATSVPSPALPSALSYVSG